MFQFEIKSFIKNLYFLNISKLNLYNINILSASKLLNNEASGHKYLSLGLGHEIAMLKVKHSI